MAKPKFNNHDLVFVLDDNELYDNYMQHYPRGFYAIPHDYTSANDKHEVCYMLMKLDNNLSYVDICGWYHEYQLKLIRHNVDMGIKDADTNKTITLKDITNG